MKKYLAVLALVIFIIPSVTFAVWWNPFTWFSNIDEINFDYNKKVNGEKQPQKKTSDIVPNQTPISISTPIPEIKTTFYVKYNDSRVRSCASTKCDTIGYFKINDTIIHKNNTPVKLDEMPEWIEFTTPDNSSAFINKTVLSESSITDQKKVYSKTKTETITGENNAAVITIDNQIIASNNEGIAYLKSEISEVNESIVFFTKLKQIFVDAINNAPKSAVIGDRYSKPTSILIESLEIDIAYLNSVAKQFNNMIDVLDNHIAIAQENKKIFKSKVYENDEKELNDAKIFLEQGRKDMEIIFKAYDISNSYGQYIIQRKSFYKKANQDFIEKLNSDIENLSKVYTPPNYSRPITPVIPMIQFPKTTRCNISPLGGGGVDLVVTCY